MSISIPTSALERFTTFGDLLRFLRRRAGITQLELAIAVGYSDGQISRLEQNLRPPDIPTIEARFIPALYLQDEKAAVARLLDLAANIRREDSPALGACPYKGLNYFDESDAEVFVGRESLVSELTSDILSFALPDSSSSSRFLAIVGASGSGKSSLMRAGLIPSLRWDKRAAGWQFRIITPTARPLESLAGELTDAGPLTRVAALADDMGRESRSLHLHVQRLAKAEGSARLVLVVDQFEELFSLCRSEAERRAFIDNLLVAASADGGPVIVVIALRADFYASCASHAGLRDALARQQKYIGAMTPEELRRTIEEPAQRGHWEFEPGLVDLLLREVGDEPGALPLLSHALVETWQRRRGRTMTLGGYTSSGGVRGAISETAESVYMDSFSQEQQAIARRIFLRLTEFGDENAAGDTRRRATFEELNHGDSQGRDIRPVLTALADARLISLSEDSAEVAHEALIREWPRLRSWLHDNREGLRLHRQLSEAAREWARLKQEREALYRGARLAQAREWAAANPNDMNALERQFLQASIDAVEWEASLRETQRQRDLEVAQNLARAEKARAEAEAQAAQRLRLRNRALASIGGIALILALLAGLLGAQARNNLGVAQTNYARAESLRLAGDANLILAQGGDPQVAALLSILALKSAYSSQADAALSASLSGLYNRKILSGHTNSIYSVAFSPDGRYALTGSQDGSTILWELQTGRQVRAFHGHSGGVSAVAYSADGKLILTGGNDGTVREWNPASGQQSFVLSGQMGGITAVAFSRDGQHILAAGGDGTARLWDASTGQVLQVFSGQGALFSDIAISPDGRSVAASSYDGSARLWDAGSGKLINTFASDLHPARLTSIAFSPDGVSLLVGSQDHTAWIWDIGTGQITCTFAGHTAAVNGVAYSPDGAYVATAGEDQTIRLWDVRTCQEIRRYVGLGAGVKSVAYSPDGQFILSGGEDDLGLLFATPASQALRVFPHITQATASFAYSPSGFYVPTTGGVNSAAFSPDGKYVLTGGDDRIARLWDASTGQQLRQFMGSSSIINSVAVSPDDKYVLAGSRDPAAELWDLGTGQLLHRVSAQVLAVDTVGFLPDGKIFLTSGVSEYGIGEQPLNPTPLMKLWDAATGQELASLNIGVKINSLFASGALAISPDGREALVRGWYTAAVLFRLATGAEICDFEDLGTITSVAFSSDGNTALTGSASAAVRLWDTRTCKQLRVFNLSGGRITSVALSPDGKTILTGHENNEARLWDVASGQMLREFTGHTAWITSVSFSPDGRYALTGSEDGTARLWDTDYHDTIRFACSLLWRDLTEDERAQYSVTGKQPACSP